MDAIDANQAVAWLKWTATVVAAAGVVFGALYKVINNMISNKIRSQLRVTIEELTKTTSASIDALRQEMRDHNDQSSQARVAAEERVERRLDGMTKRIDDVLSRMSGR